MISQGNFLREVCKGLLIALLKKMSHPEIIEGQPDRQDAYASSRESRTGGPRIQKTHAARVTSLESEMCRVSSCVERVRG